MKGKSMKNRIKKHSILRRDFLFTLTSLCLVGCKSKKTQIQSSNQLQESIEEIGVVNTVKNCQSTVQDIEGPFYIPNAPTRNKLNIFDEKGTVVKISGTVFISNCIQGTPDIYIEIWHANTLGEYDNSPEEMKYRCRIKTDVNGYYECYHLIGTI